jgi:N-methylhydantoinase A/oxoprolinase/acetone carboxylase beta subunit
VTDIAPITNNGRKINYGLGIDTGGTYTDAVIVDLQTTKVLAKSKARTTHHDLSIGLGEAVDRVLYSLGVNDFEPSLIGVSTTLATNSVLERKGGKVGLIGLGWKPEEGQEFGAKEQYFLSGGHDVRGRIQDSLDMDGVRSAIEEMAESVDSIVVSGLFSVYNSLHEIEVKRLITEEYDIPVVMGHELTGELGIYERTVTAVLNAGLIPVLTDFLKKVQEIMDVRGFKAPIMVFKGDGTLMNINAAIRRPVDTLLSGPAASAMGGKLLSGQENCIVIDIGGTSTDIAIIENGRSRISAEGAIVGSWPTRVEAVSAWTVGLGGDSEIKVSKKHGLSIGPQKVTPLCFAASSFPGLVERMMALGEARFIGASPRSFDHLSSREQMIIDHLHANGPQTFGELKQAFDEMYLIERNLGSLWSQGAIEVIGLTPTDVLHAAGIYTEGDKEAAELGVRIFAIALNMKESELTSKVIALVSSRIAEELVRKMISDEMGELPNSNVLQQMIEGMSGVRSFPNFGMKVKIGHPVIGLGGPAGAFLPSLAERLDVKVEIPDNYDVGNAIGAVCGHVSEFVDVFVYPREKGYAVYSVFSTPIFYTFESDAISKAKEMASLYAMERAKNAGGFDLQGELKIEQERERADSVLGKDALLQMRVRARAVGTPIDS